jgi:hypothetical protein
MLSHGLQILFGFSIAIGITSLVLNCALSWVICSRSNLRTTSNVFTVAICLVESVLGILYVTSGVEGLSYGQIPREHTYCVIEGYLFQTLCSISVVGIAFPCIYLHYRIVLGKPDISIWSAVLLVLSSWAIVSLGMAIPLILVHNPYSMNSSGAWCGINLVSRDPIVRFIVWMDVCLGTGVPSIMVLMFYSIFKRVTERKKKAATETSSPVPSQGSSVIDCLVKKAVWGVLLFCVSWGGLLVNFHLILDINFI